MILNIIFQLSTCKYLYSSTI